MEVGDAHVFPDFLTPVLTQISFPGHRLLFSHASAEVRGMIHSRVPNKTAFCSHRLLQQVHAIIKNLSIIKTIWSTEVSFIGWKLSVGSCASLNISLSAATTIVLADGADQEQTVLNVYLEL